MGTRATLKQFFRSWRNARYRVQAARNSLRDQAQAEELERAKEGVDRFPSPPPGGGGMGAM